MNLHLGNCLDVLRNMPDASVHAVVTDPPYGLSFMNKKWDYDVPSVEIWAECLRVLKPGGHLLAFAGTRTQHRMAVRIEDAGFEIRDMIAWVYGSGFPKSMNVGKAIDAKLTIGRCDSIAMRIRDGRTAGTVGTNMDKFRSGRNDKSEGVEAAALQKPEAQQWDGWGTALKPALEPITVARKPLVGTVAQNVLEYGTGAINVDGCRVGTEGGTTRSRQAAYAESGWRTGHSIETLQAGRWPANLIHDGSDEVVGLFPVTGPAKAANRGDRAGVTTNFGGADGLRGHDDAGGSAARFFYTAKASRSDRDPDNRHPTVKPTDLMRYLCRLVTPPGGIVLDPFMGSGSTGKAAMLEGFDFIGIERDADSFATAQRRVGRAAAAGHQPSLLEGIA